MRRLVAPVYLPWLATGLGVGMLVPVLPLYLREEGLSFSAVSVVLAASGVGAALGGLPVGSLAGRVRERTLAIMAIALLAASTLTMGFTTAVVALVALRGATGVGSIALRLAHQSIITRNVETFQRGRAMALMGGTARLAFFAGPLLGGWLADVVGFRWTFVVIGIVSGIGAVPILVDALLVRRRGVSTLAPQPTRRVRLVDAVRRHRRLLVRSGVGPALVATVRSGRLVVLPLIGVSLGLSNTAVGALVAVGTGADLLLFPVAGYVMDRYGRLAAMVPAFGLLGVGLLVLGIADSTSTVVVAGVIMGIGNGLSSGSMLTLGSDLAPVDDAGPFLAAMAAMQDSGKVVGPLVVGWFADAVSLGASAIALAVGMFVGIAWIVGVIGETSRLEPAPS